VQHSHWNTNDCWSSREIPRLVTNLSEHCHVHWMSHMNAREIWDSHGGDHLEYCLLGYNAV